MPRPYILLALFTFLSLATTTIAATDFPPSELDFPSNNPLIAACHDSDMGKVEFLLKSDQKVNTIDPRGLFPLQMAAYKGNLALIKLLLSHGANVNLSSYHGPAIVNCKTEEIALFLLKQGADLTLCAAGARGDPVSHVLFRQAAYQGWDTLLDKLHATMKNPDVIDSKGATPLFWAARMGHLEAVKSLMNWGAKVNHSAPDGDTPLIEACFGGQLNTATALLAAGANPNHATKLGRTPLEAAVACCWDPLGNAAYWHTDRRPLLGLLINRGARIDSKLLDKLKKTPCKSEYEFLLSQYAHQPTR